MDENSIPLFRLRFTKRDEPFFRPNLGGNWCQFPTTRWKDIELWEKVTVYFLRGRKHVRKRSTGLINREVLLPRIIVDYKLLVKVEGETGKRAPCRGIDYMLLI